jgi:hypothetical protein
MFFLPMIERFLYWMKSRWEDSNSFVSNFNLLRGGCTHFIAWEATGCVSVGSVLFEM